MFCLGYAFCLRLSLFSPPSYLVLLRLVLSMCCSVLIDTVRRAQEAFLVADISYWILDDTAHSETALCMLGHFGRVRLNDML